jgi:predicted phage terminase large subunit-like protein
VDYVGDDRVFIPATLNDNPFLDREAYARSLDRLDPITRERLLRGDWTVTDGGQLFNRSWFSGHYQDAAPILVGGRVRAWDLAATVSDTSKETAGVLMSRTVHGLWVVEDVIHGKWHPGERDAVIVQTAELDGQGVKVILEEEPGSGGKAQNEELIRKLAGYRVESVRVTGEKFVRAGAFASQCQAGNVNLVRGPWVHAYVEQLHSANPELVDDILLDMMDASSLAFNMLVKCSLNPMAVETPPRGMRYSPTQSDEREEVEARKEDALIERLRERRGLYDRVMDPGDDVFGDKELFL